MSARHNPNYQKMVFTASDTGIGISPSQLPFVFDKFWQVEPPEREPRVASEWDFIS